MQERGGIYIELIQESREVSLQHWGFSDLPERIAIGRSSNNDVVLSEHVVSRWHAEIVRIGSIWTFEVLGINGAYVGGQRVDRFPLWDGACVQLGQTGPRLKFSGTALRANPEIAPQPQQQLDRRSGKVAKLDLLRSSMDWTVEEPQPLKPLVSRAQTIALGPSRG